MTRTIYYSMKTGEELDVLEFFGCDRIIIRYKNKNYPRSKDIIGKTIRKVKYGTVGCNDRVTIKECKSNNISRYVMRDTYATEITVMKAGARGYTRYEVIDVKKHTADDDFETLDITTPFGKMIYGSRIGDTFMGMNENLEMTDYEIVDIQ